MAVPFFCNDGTLGVDVGGPEDTQTHALGTVRRAAANNVLIYVVANVAITSGSGVALGTSFTASVGTISAPLHTLYAIGSGQFGWVENKLNDLPVIDFNR